LSSALAWIGLGVRPWRRPHHWPWLRPRSCD